ncbi:MAG: exodeoxyribonuclease VII small subunit [Candidatus Saccharibacteria bacterium]|nr:exodeoxyribonuclease VII small subunit [Rhodoferax sp.]
MADKTFKEAYGVLQRHAETLRRQQDPNIDDLLNIVTESVDAYKVCKERIDAVEKALEKALGDTTPDTPESTRAVRPVPPPPDMEEEEDLPF